MEMKITADNREEVESELRKRLDGYKRGLYLTMWRALKILEAAAKNNVRRRSGLHVRTGALLNSIQSSVEINGDDIVGYLGSYGVPYAAVHEFGHTFGPRLVQPRFKKALHWSKDGRDYFSKGHTIGPFRVPARPYLRPAIEENKQLIADRFRLFIVEQFTLGA